MKKILIGLFSLFISSVTFADTNVMFGEKNNSFTLYTAQSTGSGSLSNLVYICYYEISPQTFFLLKYRQPIQFVRLDSRLNLNIGQNLARQSSRGLSFFGIGISIDTALLQYDGWYFGIGIGPFMRDYMDDWVASRLVFEEKVFLGKNFGENWHAELFTVHFSNGNFTEPNEGFNFFGVGIGYRF